jgi:hypothetical protein
MIASQNRGGGGPNGPAAARARGGVCARPGPTPTEIAHLAADLLFRGEAQSYAVATALARAKLNPQGGAPTRPGHPPSRRWMKRKVT